MRGQIFRTSNPQISCLSCDKEVIRKKARNDKIGCTHKRTLHILINLTNPLWQPEEQQLRPPCGLISSQFHSASVFSTTITEQASCIEGDNKSGLDSSLSDKRSIILASELRGPWVYFCPILFVAVDSVGGGEANGNRQSGGHGLGR